MNGAVDTTRRGRGWLVPFVLATIVAGEVVVAHGRHRSDAELVGLARSRAINVRIDEQIDALHQLANRGEASAALLPALADDEDLRVRELTLTADWLRRAPAAERTRLVAQTKKQLRAATDSRADAEAFRAAFLLFNQLNVGAERRLELPAREIDWFQAACDGKAPPHDELMRFLVDRYPGAKLDR